MMMMLKRNIMVIAMIRMMMINLVGYCRLPVYARSSNTTPMTNMTTTVMIIMITSRKRRSKKREEET